MIYVPYVEGGLKPETKGWADDFGALYVNVEGPTAYWEALCEWWTKPGHLIIVEQDMIPGVNVVENMRECEAPWCTSPYQVFNGLAGMTLTGLGVAKFSQELKVRHPGMAQAAGLPYGESDPIGEWQHLDSRLYQRLMQHGYRPHIHGPSQHLHVYTEEQLDKVRTAIAKIQERERQQHAS